MHDGNARAAAVGLSVLRIADTAKRVQENRRSLNANAPFRNKADIVTRSNDPSYGEKTVLEIQVSQYAKSDLSADFRRHHTVSIFIVSVDAVTEFPDRLFEHIPGLSTMFFVKTRDSGAHCVSVKVDNGDKAG